MFVNKLYKNICSILKTISPEIVFIGVYFICSEQIINIK